MTTAIKRLPAQPRGKQRVECILQACAQLLIEDSNSAFTMQRLAKRAKTSTGSLYHFFADKDGVLQALAGRHVAAGAALLEMLERTPADQWAAMSVDQVITELFLLNVNYVRGHPDVVILWNEGRFRNEAANKVKRGIVALYESILRIRLPQADDASISRHALALHQLPIGFLTTDLHGSQELAQSLVLTEAPIALAAYLERIERTYQH